MDISDLWLCDLVLMPHLDQTIMKPKHKRAVLLPYTGFDAKTHNRVEKGREYVERAHRDYPTKPSLYENLMFSFMI